DFSNNPMRTGNAVPEFEWRLSGGQAGTTPGIRDPWILLRRLSNRQISLVGLGGVRVFQCLRCAPFEVMDLRKVAKGWNLVQKDGGRLPFALQTDIQFAQGILE